MNASLEDKFLRQNVPGRWSSLDDKTDLRAGEQEPDAADEVAEFEGAEPSEDPSGVSQTETTRLLNDASISDAVKSTIVAERMRKPGAGAKGVLADYAMEQSLKKAERESKAAQRDAILHRMACGATVPSSGLPQATGQATVGDDDEDDLDEEDAKFMEQFRSARLRELQSQGQRPRYGDVDTVGTSAELIDQVTSCDPRTTIVVLMFEPSVAGCMLMNRYIEELAAKWEEVRFLRIKASDTELMIDRIALPALSIYRAGDIVTVLAGLTEELGDRFSRDDVEWSEVAVTAVP